MNDNDFCLPSLIAGLFTCLFLQSTSFCLLYFFYHSWQTVWWLFVFFHTILRAWTNDSCFHIVYVHCGRILVCSAAPLFVCRDEAILYCFANQLFLTWEYFVCSEILVTCLQWKAIYIFCFQWNGSRFFTVQGRYMYFVCCGIIVVCSEIVVL